MTARLPLGLAMIAMVLPGISGANEYFAAHHLPPSQPWAAGSYHAWADELREKTSGALDFKVFDSASLFNPNSALTAVGDGVAQVGFVTANYVPSSLPVTASIGDVGFKHPDPYVLISAVTDFMINDPQGHREWRDAGVLPTMGFTTLDYQFICSAPLKTAADFVGKKIRTSTSGMAAFAQALGATPISIPSTEVYLAMNSGAIDCTAGDVTFLTSGNKLLELAKGMMMIRLAPSFTGASHGVNVDFWKSLSEEQRRIFLDAEAHGIARVMQLYEEQSEDALNQARGKIEIFEPGDDLRQALAKFIADNEAAQIKLATDLKVENPDDLMRRFSEYCVKWENYLAGIDRKDPEAFAALLKENLYDKIDVARFGLE